MAFSWAEEVKRSISAKKRRKQTMLKNGETVEATKIQKRIDKLGV